MPYYARIIFDTDASVAERHDDLSRARCWIDNERQAKPGLFRCGQIVETTPDPRVIATCGVGGWDVRQRCAGPAAEVRPETAWALFPPTD